MFVAGLESRPKKYFSPEVLPKRQINHARRVQISGEDKTVSFSVAQDEHKRAAARDLLNDRYGWRGYGSAHDLHSDIQHTTFVAEVDGQVVGTMTLAVDSDRGLAIDRTFADVVGQIRREPGTGICELTKLAFDDSVRSKEVLAGLFHLAFIYGTTHTDCTDLFIEVNPRHVRFYEAMLGFEGVGSLRTNASVDAPSQLMRLGVDAIRDNIREMTGTPPVASARSLYPYFFPPEEERQIRRLLGSARPSAADRRARLFESASGLLDARVEEGADATGCFKTEHMRSAA
jgi:hypothetical protein